MSSADTILRLPEVLAIIPVSRATWYEGIKTGRFPAQVKLASASPLGDAAISTASSLRLTRSAVGRNPRCLAAIESNKGIPYGGHTRNSPPFHSEGYPGTPHLWPRLPRNVEGPLC